MTSAGLRQLLAGSTLVLGLASVSWAAGDTGVAWSSLSRSQQQILAPLQRDWSVIEPTRRQKWLELASRFPSMPADERARVQERMADWARLTPAQRTQARLQFQESRQLPPEERNAKWQAYQALSPTEKQTLAQRAKPVEKAASGAENSARPKQAPDTTAQNKRPANTAAAASAASGRPITPIVVQARPGATTTTMTVRAPQPVKRLPAGPKIAATSTDVDPATLLPKRTPQASAKPASGSEGVEQQPL